LVRVLSCGLCASDLKMFRFGHKELSLPRVLGHEISGEVAEVEAGVQGLAPGELVQIYPGLSCGRCRACQEGRENLCPQVKVLGFSLDGGLAQYLALPARALDQGGVNPLPAGLASDTATLAEPLACALNALDQARLRPGERVAIFGAGVLGRLLALAAQEAGASSVVLLETDYRRLAHLPAPGVLLEGGGDPPPALAPLEGRADVVVPACPDPRAVEWGLGLLAPAGRLVLFSGLAGRPGLDLNQLHYGQQTLVGAYGCTVEQNRRALELLARWPGASSLITLRLPLEQCGQGLAAMGRAEQLKVVINPFAQ
jgi:L-iditol 2-dehydrogenase